MSIRPFALERYFAEHEFTAELLLCSSDVEAYGMRELLALADDETRALWDGLGLGYTETPGHPLLRPELAARDPGLPVAARGGARRGRAGDPRRARARERVGARPRRRAPRAAPRHAGDR